MGSDIKAGTLLVADMMLETDDAFARSVILVLGYEKGRGAIGINIARDMEGIDGILEGGPVPSSLVLHKNENTAKASPVGMTGYAVTRFGELSPEGVQVEGHAAWGPGQLENELLMGAWKVTGASLETVMSAKPKNRWSVAKAGIEAEPDMDSDAGASPVSVSAVPAATKKSKNKPFTM